MRYLVIVKAEDLHEVVAAEHVDHFEAWKAQRELARAGCRVVVREVRL